MPRQRWKDHPELPRRLAPYLYVPDDDLASFPPLVEVPEGIVWHSGDVGAALGEYTTNEPDGRCVAYTFAWFARRFGGCLVQTVPLDVRAYHAGRGNVWWGAGLPGPAAQNPRPDTQKAQAQGLVLALRAVLGRDHPRYWCRHSDIDETRHDPGPGFLDAWMEEVGLEWKIPPGCRLVVR